MNHRPHFFPVRHLSPAGAWHLLEFLEEIQPDIVMIEGPSNIREELNDIVKKNVKPPIAILAYTEELPVKTILYPFADYSPEYQGIKWAKENKKEVRFIDLPTEIFLALETDKSKEVDKEQVEEKIKEESKPINIYEEIYKLTGDMDYDTFWERNFEHNTNKDTYRLAMLAFGKELRELTEKREIDDARNCVREGFMKYQIQKAVAEGYDYDKMVVITGAYHTSSLMDEESMALTEEDIKSLPRIKSHVTLMPYSYYRLSNSGGYGAGNSSPYYYEMMWEYMKQGRLEELPQYYMTFIVNALREEGHIKSSAEVIEGVRLALGLAKMHGGTLPTIGDLRDGAKTCLGEGSLSKVAGAIAKVEVGTKIGELPEGMSKTALQNNFNYMLKDLKLEKYKSVVAEDLTLDLRENRQVKSEKAAFLDLHRSYFLHQLSVLGVSFGRIRPSYQEGANWKEEWTLSWSPETEIELVEASLYGDTVQMTAAYKLKERLDNCTKVKEAAHIVATCYACGMPEMITYAVGILESLSVETEAFDEITDAALALSGIVRFGSIRRIDMTNIEPMLTKLFLRASLLMVDTATCDYEAAKVIGEAIENLDKIASFHAEIVDVDTYINELTILSNRDDRNAKLSGMACSILLERSLMTKEMLMLEMSRRLLPGIPADIGAGWFEGLASRNRYIILSNLTIWEKLDEYITALTVEELKSAIVFLHRTFSSFAPNEKHMIAENLANLWGLDQDDVSEYLNQDLSEEEEKMIESLEDFDFDF